MTFPNSEETLQASEALPHFASPWRQLQFRKVEVDRTRAAPVNELANNFD